MSKEAIAAGEAIRAILSADFHMIGVRVDCSPASASNACLWAFTVYANGRTGAANVLIPANLETYQLAAASIVDQLIN